MTRHLNKIEIEAEPDGGWTVGLWYAPTRPPAERITIEYADEIEVRHFTQGERGAMINFVTRLAASIGLSVPDLP